MFFYWINSKKAAVSTKVTDLILFGKKGDYKLKNL